MHDRLLLLALAALTVMSACEKPFDYDGAVSPELVVNSQLIAGAAPVVKLRAVTELNVLLDATELEGSYVTLEDSEGTYHELSALNLGTYEASYSLTEHAPIVAGRSYTLTIDAPGFAQITSRTTIPHSAAIGLPTSAQIRIDTSLLGKDVIHLPLEIEDVPEVENHYHVLVTAYDRALGSETAAIRGGIKEPFRFANRVDGGVDLGDGGQLFSDQTPGSEDAGIITTTLAVPADDFRSMAEPTLHVEVRTVTDTYYHYYRSQAGVSNGKLPDVSTPDLDNINGAVGLFGGYSSQFSSVPVAL